jgi:uncharacterized protein (TIGR03382 family)
VHSDHRPVPGARALLLTLPVLVFGAASLANGGHGLLYVPGTAPGALSHGVVRMNFQRGPLFWLQAAYAYGLLLYCSLLVLGALRTTGAERRHWLGFLGMTLVPWAANVAYLAFGLRVYGSDPTPMSFGLAVVGMAWLMRRRGLFEVVPMARRLLYTELVDPVLVLDAGKRVMDANEAALTLARSAGATLRSTDTVCRTGGEEFVLLLPNADGDAARRRVEALLRRIADTDHGLDGRRVTLSAGVAALEPGLDTLDALLQKADRALYRAKSGGRDRSEMATLPMPLDEPPPA